MSKENKFISIEDLEKHIEEFHKNPSFFYKYIYWPYSDIKEKIHKIRNFVKNSFKFRKELSEFYPFDSIDALILFKKALEELLFQYKNLGKTLFDYEGSSEHKKALRKTIRILKRLINYDTIYFNILERKCGKFTLLNERQKKLFLEEENELFEKDKQTFLELFSKYFFYWWL